MENTTLKAENLKPIILKAGVPLAVSFAGLIYAWIMAKKSLSKVSSFTENKVDKPENNSLQGSKYEESFENENHTSIEDEEESATPLDSSVLNSLRNQIEGMQIRELALTLQFEKYCEKKEQESLVMEMKNMLSLETAHVEFLDREISFIENEAMRLENFVVQYLKITEKIEYWKSENEMLQKKVKKLVRKSKAQSHLIKEQNLKIKEGEAEILRNHDALQIKDSVINKLEEDIRELERVLEQLHDENNELLRKLEIVESSKEELHRKSLKYYLEVESGDVKKEDYYKLLKELEQVKKEHATEVEELIHLRKINSCLRQELMKNHEEQKDEYDSEHELHCSFLEHQNVSCIGSTSSSAHGDPAFSKRRRFLRRLKKWVEGSEKARVEPEAKSSHEIKCFGSEKPEGSATPRFCSSA